MQDTNRSGHAQTRTHSASDSVISTPPTSPDDALYRYAARVARQVSTIACSTTMIVVNFSTRDSESIVSTSIPPPLLLPVTSLTVCPTSVKDRKSTRLNSSH